MFGNNLANNPFLMDFVRNTRKPQAEVPPQQTKKPHTATVSAQGPELSVESIISSKPKPAKVLEYLRHIIAQFEATL